MIGSSGTCSIARSAMVVYWKVIDLKISLDTLSVRVHVSIPLTIPKAKSARMMCQPRYHKICQNTPGKKDEKNTACVMR